ncbi:protein FAF-like, chloroplastic [Cynara cardunculus var. scolymus]|uniref:FAF domain-containing protein n=1 Tax=Cynara cardunculus var. scolymus TaxID=59895 RepID=A0A103XH93_CYNCS|nr:protein FAF-like, chloroplastic [Cynara cardunculus var. scolymus]KVH90665.1 hypothetical protein Ccrd_007320 [Cynara cardunculus var. scolymus]
MLSPSASLINHKPDFNHQHYTMSLESLSICTEGLGFESFDDVEDQLETDSHEVKLGTTTTTTTTTTTKRAAAISMLGDGGKRSRITGSELPPPISSLGRSGKPWVCLKSYRENGRFILKEVRIRTHESLHASREDGRLKLKFIQFDDDDDDDVIASH